MDEASWIVLAGIVSACLAFLLRSRCTHIETPCFKIDQPPQPAPPEHTTV